MEWFDEVRLSRHAIAEIGVAFYIRRMMRNSWTPSYEDLREAFGADWRDLLESLRRSGMLRVEYFKRTASLKIVAPGDARRERNRKIQIRKRATKGQNQ